MQREVPAEMHVDHDRGTLILRPEPTEGSVAFPEGLVQHDERVGVLRAPACRRGELLRFLRELGLTLTGSAAADPPTRVPRARIPLDLRDYQRRAVEAWLVAGRRGVVALPTGSGKTRVALGALLATPQSALVLVPTRVLLHQWVAVLREHLEEPIAVFGDGHHDVGPVTVATHAALLLNAERLGGQFGLLIVDEAHHFGPEDPTQPMRAALDLLVAEARLGLTATPPTQAAAIASLTSALGPVICRERLDSLAGTSLAPFDRIVIPIRLTPAAREAYDRDYRRFRQTYDVWHRAAPASTWSGFVRACSRTADGREALVAWGRCRRLAAYSDAKEAVLAELIEMHKTDRSLIFAEDTATVYHVCRRFLIAPITAEIGPAERREVLEAFQAGHLNAIVSARVLNEGVDVPDADVAIILSGRGGSIEHVQRVGRVLRPRPGKQATVYELCTVRTVEEGTSRRRREWLDAA